MKQSLVTVILMALLVNAHSVSAKPSDEFYAKMNRMCVDTDAGSSAVYITSCYQYIRGFLKGALVTESTIAKGFITGKFNSEFVSKAGLTQDSDWRKAVHMSGYTGFCLPSDDVTHDVVVSLLKGIQQKFESVQGEIPENPLSEHLYELLMERYTCDWVIRSSEPAP